MNTGLFKTIKENAFLLAFSFMFILLLSSHSALAQYKYEHKYGTNQYNYDVYGTSDTGDVTGNVDTNGKYIDGYIEDEYGNEKHFEGEWTGYGVIEGYDEDGNYVELEVE